MRTEHVLRVGDAAAMDALADESVELVVTSPPYPMIDLWDDLFADRNPDVRAALDAGDGGYAAEHFDFRVVTKRERRIRPYAVESVTARPTDRGREYVLDHRPTDGDA